MFCDQRQTGELKAAFLKCYELEREKLNRRTIRYVRVATIGILGSSVLMIVMGTLLQKLIFLFFICVGLASCVMLGYSAYMLSRPHSPFQNFEKIRSEVDDIDQNEWDIFQNLVRAVRNEDKDSIKNFLLEIQEDDLSLAKWSFLFVIYKAFSLPR